MIRSPAGVVPIERLNGGLIGAGCMIC